MEKIPVRTIRAIPNASDVHESFSIREVGDLLAGQEMVQPLHRHDFFFLLALKKGSGTHAIDFTSYEAGDNTVFLMRPGQVHWLVLKAGSTGYLMQFGPDFYAPHDPVARQLLRKANSSNHYQLDAHRFQKLLSILSSIFHEYTDQQERYQAVIQANLGIAFIELVRHCSQCSENQASPYRQERLEEFMDLLETHIFTHKQVAHYGLELPIGA
jgi:AraC family transcriptional regulator, transcriptional activator of pobA